MVAGASIVVLLFVGALVVAVAQGAALEPLQEATSTVKRWAAHVLAAVGVWLVVLATFAESFARILPV